MKILSWNVNGLRAIVRKGFTNFLQTNDFDIIGVQEIKVSNEARLREKFDWQNYFEYWHPAQRPGYSGTGVLSKIEPIGIEFGFSKQDKDEEGRIQTLEFAKFYFVNVYFPNAQHGLLRLDYKLEFNKKLLSHLKKLDKKKPVVLGGDFNVAREEIDLKNPQSNHHNPGFSDEERDSARKYLSAGFIDTFRHFHPQKVQYSWWSYRFQARARNIGWRIDYFLVSSRIIDKVKQAYILDKIQGSDHAPVGIELDF